MPHTVWKFDLPLKDEQVIEMPHTAELLTVQVQIPVSMAGVRPHECLKLWARVNPDNAKVKRRIVIAGTGHVAPSLYYWGGPGLQAQPASGVYVATVQTGAYVWHVFDMGEEG